MKAKYYAVKNENLIRRSRRKEGYTNIIMREDFIRIVNYYKARAISSENGKMELDRLRKKIRELEWDLASKQSEINLLKENQNAIFHNN